MNLPLQKIHHITHSYGRLWFPIWPKFWVAQFEKYFFTGTQTHVPPRTKIVRTKDFHNCTATGIY